MKGAPLRFAGVVVGGWVAGRLVALAPDSAVPLLSPIAVARAAEPVRRPASPSVASAAPSRSPIRRATIATAAVRPVIRPHDPPVAPPPAAPARAASPVVAVPIPLPAAAVPDPLPAMLPPTTGTPSRWAGDAWLVARGGEGEGERLGFGQLGASQAGGRLTYALDARHRLALSARLAVPAHGPGAETGLGIDLKPVALPDHLLIEERVGLDGRPARAAAQAYAGGSVALPAGVRLDAYAQGGAVERRGGFADGAATAMRPLVTGHAARVELGGGAWGAAQRGVSRVDVGPAAALIVPTGHTALRLGLDYRLRVAGRARPGNGPALTLGASF